MDRVMDRMVYRVMMHHPMTPVMDRVMYGMMNLRGCKTA
jgi:hypothetical protein